MDLSMDNGNEEKLLKALESNWQHARHVEVLRLQFAGVYVVALFGGALAAFSNGDSPVSVIVVAAMLITTAWALGMTHKWNMEFANQIQKADVCARSLKISIENSPPTNMHEMMGFPVRGKILRRLSTRSMFYLFYGTFLVGWIWLLVYFWMGLGGGNT